MTPQARLLADFTAAARKEEGMKAAILVGSMATGVVDELSDVDVILVVDDVALAAVRRNWRGLIPRRVLYSSDVGGFPSDSALAVLTADLVVLDLTFCSSKSPIWIHKPHRVLFDDGVVAAILPPAGCEGAGLERCSGEATDPAFAILRMVRRYMRGERECCLGSNSAPRDSQSNY